MAKKQKSKKYSPSLKTAIGRSTRRPRAAESILLWTQAHSHVVFLVLMTIASLRIISTYNVFSHTSDEPTHIACGMEWLSKGTFLYEPKHPPLARVAAAMGPYLAGVRSYGTRNMFTEGLAVLLRDGHYDRNLFLARLGILPFFWVASLVVYLWAKKYVGEPGATVAVLFFTFLPPILAHGGLATTDMALAAMVGASFLSGLVWLEQPTARYGLLFGALTGLAVLSKLSALVFIPAGFAAALIWYVLTTRPGIFSILRAVKAHLATFALAVLTGSVTIWAGYRFSVGSVSFATVRLPAPELYAGIQQLIEHNRVGHPAYLLGQHSRSGWWYYYLVVLAVKTPLPFLAMLLYGLLCKKKRESTFATGLAMAFSLGILLFSLTSRINIGVRHILPVYIGFSVVVGAAATRLVQRARNFRLAAYMFGGLVLWMVLGSALSHPDYLPYFNALAGNRPEQVLIDSDLDWSQDMKRTAKRLKALGAAEVAYSPFSLSDPVAQGFPPVKRFNPLTPSPGWNAANLTMLKGLRFGYWEHPEVKFWADEIKPTERIGKGMLLWYFPPSKPSEQ